MTYWQILAYIRLMHNAFRDFFTDDAESDRYITMAGDPIHSPLVKSFFQAADFKASILATLASGLLIHELNQKPYSAMMAVSGINMCLSAILRSAEFAYLDKRLRRDDLCIDTRPDKKKPPTSSEFVIAAQRTRNMIGIFTGLMAAALPLVISAAPSDSKTKILFMLATISPLIRSITAFRRFNNVAAGRWAIVDMPPPEPEREPAKELIPVYIRS